MIDKIVTHKPPRHVDDFLAVSFLKTEFPNVEIEYLSPQEVPDIYLINNKICLVDVGGDFNPELNNFDHHQNINLTCSLSQILSYFKGSDFSLHPVIKMIDLIDRYGVNNVIKQTNYKFSQNILDYRKIILHVDINKYASKITNIFFSLLQTTFDYNNFWVLFYQKLDQNKILDNAKELITLTEQDLIRKLQQSQQFNVNGLRILLSKETFAPLHYKIFQLTNIDLIVEPNSMNSKQTTIIKNNFSPFKIDLSKIFNVYPKVFLHGTGFLAVVDVDICKFDIACLTKLFIKKSPSSIGCRL